MAPSRCVDERRAMAGSELLSLAYVLTLMLDGYTNVFQVPGTRTTGEKPQKCAIAGPGWSAAPPAGVTEYKSPTEHELENSERMKVRNGLSDPKFIVLNPAHDLVAYCRWCVSVLVVLRSPARMSGFFSVLRSASSASICLRRHDGAHLFSK